MGKANSEKPQVVATKKLVNGLNTPTMKGQADSVSGLCHTLVKVGIAASASLTIAKVIAKLGLLVTNQRATARPDSTPHR